MEENKNKKQSNKEIDPVTNDEFVQGHEFDGIRELANNPPPWLTILFIITVIFAYGYLFRYHYFKSKPLQAEEYQMELAKFEMMNAEPVEELVAEEGEELSEEERAERQREADLAAGSNIFKNYCAVCHLAQGQGSTGPNLTDEYWLHGGSYEDIVNVVTNGVIEKGMIPWKNQISERQIRQVSLFVESLRGTNPPNPKEPQGEKYVPEE